MAPIYSTVRLSVHEIVIHSTGVSSKKETLQHFRLPSANIIIRLFAPSAVVSQEQLSVHPSSFLGCPSPSCRHHRA